MLFDRPLIVNSAGRNQWTDVNYNRSQAEHGQAQSVVGAMSLAVNAGRSPEDLYREFDSETVERFRSDDGDTFINDLMPLSRSVNIGKLVYEFRRASDAGRVQTSMSGQIGVKMDQVEYLYDGTIVPIHDTGFSRNFREWNAGKPENFDALVDDQRESVTALRRDWADTILDGCKDKDGNVIVLDGRSWSGMRNDARVAQIDLGAGGLNFDFTDNTKTGDEIKAAFITIRDTLWITNNCEKEVTYYISREVAANMERKFSTAYDGPTIMQELGNLQGVAAIKASSKLSGNELMGFPLDKSAVRPIVGMGINTVAMPRPVYNSNYDFVTWHAAGFQVVNDFAGRTCAIMAQA